MKTSLHETHALLINIGLINGAVWGAYTCMYMISLSKRGLGVRMYVRVTGKGRASIGEREGGRERASCGITRL